MSFLFPRRWPVRWRIAAVSAALTFAILVCFALVVGQLAADRLRDDFRDEVETAARGLAVYAASDEEVRDPELARMAMAQDSEVRLVDSEGNVLSGTPGAPALGPPSPQTVSVDGYEVASEPVRSTEFATPLFVQYARSRGSLDTTIDRLWLFLAGGVLGGTVLATLAGLAVAGRAMAPIAGLTTAAREIATTRDPSRRLPRPESDDEVGELAATLDQMLRELDAARAETEQMFQAQRDFVADASHELRTPLTSILANLELLQDRFGTAARDREEAEIVAGALGSSLRMRRLVSDLLVLARADAGRRGPERACDLVEVASAALGEVRSLATGHEIELAAEDAVPLLGNPDDLHRLAVNLLENAVRHTEPGTRVRIEVRAQSGTAMLEVSDDGPGLPAELGNSIFGRFVRGAGPADTASEPGTGLGLAIVQAVASSHGGTVEAGRSAEGGARFTVRMPLGSKPRAEAPLPVG